MNEVKEYIEVELIEDKVYEDGEIIPAGTKAWVSEMEPGADWCYIDYINSIGEEVCSPIETKKLKSVTKN